MFSGLEADLLQNLEPGLELVSLAAGETLVRQGEAGDALFVLTSGELEVRVTTEGGGEVVVDRLEPGAGVGEMALVAGQERTATVVALVEAELVRLSRLDFDRLSDATPGLREAVVHAMRPRLQRIQLSGVLETWFPDLTAAQIHELQEAVTWVHVAGGEPVYAAGDDADGMYLLVSGRLRSIATDRDGNVLSTVELSRGASIGEYAVLGEGARSETVMAIRDSQLVRLDRELVALHPQVMVQIARNALARANAGGPQKVGSGNGVRTIALVPAQDDAPLDDVIRLLQQELRGWGKVTTLDSGEVERRFGGQGAAQSGRDDALWSALTYWLNEVEAAHEYTLLVTDSGLTEWTRRCLGQADQVVVVANALSDHEPGPVERAMSEVPARSLNLVLVHDDAADQPRGTARWLEARPPLEHHHLRTGVGADAGRLARRLTGRALGLVLSGGGARGYVHLGLIRALLELRQPVDMIAGTSMGALIGAIYAYKQSFDLVLQTAHRFGDPKKLLDRTLPLVALAKSHSVTEMFTGLFEDARLEDFWLPFRCVSANLSKADLVVHQRGLAWEAVRASTAIPGVFTPLVQDGDILVDGGIMNNYPVDIMREMIGTGLIIGSNAGGGTRNRAFEFGPSISGWRVLFERLLPRGRRTRYPSILGTLMRATSVNSKYLGAAADALADLAIRYPTQEYGNLEFDKYPQLAEIGYATSMERLQDWVDLPVRSTG